MQEDWTPQDDKILLSTYNTHGNNWEAFVEFLPNHNSQQCIDRWKQLSKTDNTSNYHKELESVNDIENEIKRLENDSEAIRNKISLLKDKQNQLNQLNQPKTSSKTNNTLTILLETKILSYQFEDSIKKNTFYDFYQSIGLVCKRWYYKILPQLLSVQPVFKNDDYLYTYLKVRDLCKEILNRRTDTPYQLSSEREITNLFRTLYVPNVSTGCCKIDLNKEPQLDKNSQSYYNYYKKDYQIYINNQVCGTIYNPDINLILQNANPAKFGKGTELVYDESIRKGLSISGDIINVPFFNDSTEYVPNSNFELVISKIHIYQEGGKFEEHIDTIRAKNHVGTFIFPLGTSKYYGGEFIVSETQSLDPKDESTLVYRIEGTEISEKVYEFNWISFYNDCLHKVSPITSGVRIVLQFNVHTKKYSKQNMNPPHLNIYGDGHGLREGDPYPIEKITYDRKSQYLTHNNSKLIQYLQKNDEVLAKLSIKLDRIIQSKKKNVGLFLNHLYKAHIKKTHLKGVDLDIWNGLAKHFGESRLKISSFLVSQYYDDESEKVKIDIINNSTINQSFNIEADVFSHTLLYCGSKYSNLKSIHSKELPSTGNEERSSDDVGCFSAIVIKRE